MTKLNDYHHFIGRHWETGSVCNYYAYRGEKAPHTGRPYSEALLLGISGGAVMGYFSFAYQGYDPHVAILTRNTFDPLTTLLERLGVSQDVRQTSKPETGKANLLDALENGVPPLVWADQYSLPYNALPSDSGMWYMAPLLVYGLEPEAVWIADRAQVPLNVTPEELASARGRVKQDKHRLVTLGPPDESKLLAAVQKGIWDSIRLFTEAPPKGSRQNFGFAAYQQWAELLTKPKARNSWERVFPAGRKMAAGLTSAYSSIAIVSGDGRAEREAYASFLNEAAILLERPGLREAEACFLRSAPAWEGLAAALLPDEVAPFGEMRRLMLKRKNVFLQEGGEARPELQEIDDRLETLKAEMDSSFPLDEAEVRALRQGLAERIFQIHDLELEAVGALQDAMR